MTTSDDQRSPVSRAKGFRPDRSFFLCSKERVESHRPCLSRGLDFETRLPTITSYKSSSQAQFQTPAPPNFSKFKRPLEWPRLRKRATIYSSLSITVLTAFAIGSYSPAIDQMISEWKITSAESLLGVTLFIYGIGLAPMFLAPFSELNGRKTVVLATGGLFVLGQVCCCVTPTFAGMLIGRFMAGVGGSTFSTMIGGIISDVYDAEERNTPMTLQAAAAIIGTGLGPLVSAFIASHVSWRWIFASQSIAALLALAAVALFFQETRASALLHSKAKGLNAWYSECDSLGFCDIEILRLQDDSNGIPPQIRWHVSPEFARPSISETLRISSIRPFHLLVSEPIVFYFSIWVSFAWGILYLAFEAIPIVFEGEYGFTLANSNAVFAAVVVGGIIGPALSILQDSSYHRWASKNRTQDDRDPIIKRILLAHADKPERRLHFASWASVLLVIGMFTFGLTAAAHVHFMVPACAVLLITVGIFSIYLAAFNYLADSYGSYASSAIAGQSFCRQMVSGAFPLVTRQLYQNLGYARVSNLLGGIAAGLTVVPWVLLAFGPRIRKRSKFAETQVEMPER